MIWVLSAAGLLIALGIAALFLRVTLHLSVQGRGDPSGQWALAGGARVFPMSVAGLGGRGAKPVVVTYLFGREVSRRELLEAKDEEEETEEETESATLAQRYERVGRWVDPIDLAFFLFSERRRIAVPEMELEIDYCFEDIMLTGQLMSAVHLLNGVLPKPLVVRQTVGWDFVDRAAFNGHGRLAFRPGLVLWDVCVFMTKNIRLRPPTVAPAVGS